MSQEVQLSTFRPRMVESQIIQRQGENKTTSFNPFKFCLQPLTDADNEIVFSRRTVAPSRYSTFSQPQPHILAFKQKHPMRLLDKPIGLSTQQHEPASVSLAPNKFQHRQYVETESHFSDLSRQTFKKQMYQLFLERKQKDIRLWNANFELIWLELMKEEGGLANISQRLLSKLDSFKEQPY